MKTYILVDQEIPQVIGFEDHVVLESDSLREIRAQARKRGLSGWVIARRAMRRHGGDGAWLFAKPARS